MSFQAILSLVVCSLDLANDLRSKFGQAAWESHRQKHRVRRLSDKHHHSIDWAAAFLYKALVRSQPVGLGGSLVFHHRFIFVIQPILWIRTRWKRQAEPFIHSIPERPVRRKKPRDDFSDVESTGSFAGAVRDCNHRIRQPVLVGREYFCRVNWLGAYKQGVATRAINSKAIPTSRGENAVSESGFIEGQPSSSLRVRRNRHS